MAIGLQGMNKKPVDYNHLSSLGLYNSCVNVCSVGKNRKHLSYSSVRDVQRSIQPSTLQFAQFSTNK